MSSFNALPHGTSRHYRRNIALHITVTRLSYSVTSRKQFSVHLFNFSLRSLASKAYKARHSEDKANNMVKEVYLK